MKRSIDDIIREENKKADTAEDVVRVVRAQYPEHYANNRAKLRRLVHEGRDKPTTEFLSQPSNIPDGYVSANDAAKWSRDDGRRLEEKVVRSIVDRISPHNPPEGSKYSPCREDPVQRVLIRFDTTDHFDMQHTSCGMKLQMRIKTDMKHSVNLVTQWIELRCYYCKTGWVKWRKTNLRMGNEWIRTPENKRLMNE